MDKLNWIVFREIEQHINKFGYKMPKGSLYNFWRNNQQELNFIDGIDTKMEFIKDQDRRLLSNQGFLKICRIHFLLQRQTKKLLESIFNIILTDESLSLLFSKFESESKIKTELVSQTNLVNQQPNQQNWSIISTDYFNNQLYEVLINNETNEFGMTAEQLGTVLNYLNPQDGINHLINRNKYLNDKEFTTYDKMSYHDKTYNTRIFTEDGIYEVTMLSSTEVAKEFRHKIRQLLKSLRKGENVIISQQQLKNICDKIDNLYSLSVENKLRLNNLETKINLLPEYQEIKDYKSKCEQIHKITEEIIKSK